MTKKKKKGRKLSYAYRDIAKLLLLLLLMNHLWSLKMKKVKNILQILY